MKRYLRVTLMLFFSCWASTSAFAQQRPTFSRRIVGSVWNREHHAVSGAKVCATPNGGLGTRIPCGTSAADGAFTIDVQWPGRTYTISVEDLAAGYPDASNAFFGSFFGELPEITVTETNALKPVDVMVGPKAGRVVFSIVDDKRGKPIEGGVVKVCRTDRPRICWTISIGFPHGRYEMLTPEVPFTIEFGTWYRQERSVARSAVDQAGVPVTRMSVGLGERKEMTVRLKLLPVKRGDRQVVP